MIGRTLRGALHYCRATATFTEQSLRTDHNDKHAGITITKAEGDLQCDE